MTRIPAIEMRNDGPLGASRDVAWPRIPVAHLSCETDVHFCALPCRPGR